MKVPTDAAGHAALAICESLLLSLTERNLLDTKEARAVLADAASAHRNAMAAADDPALHESAAQIIELMLRGGNSVHGA